jgi:hypothetical protein
MDMPVGLVQWEVFLPTRYKVADFGGNVIPDSLVALAGPDPAAGESGASGSTNPIVSMEPGIGANGTSAQIVADARGPALGSGMVGGLVIDPSGAVVRGARLTVADLATGFTRTAGSDPTGRWVVAGFSSGKLRVTAAAPGFRTDVLEVNYVSTQPRQVDVMLNVGSTSDSVEVTAEAPQGFSNKKGTFPSKALPPPPAPAEPSSAVLELKQKVAGVLPISIDIPRTGTSYRFVKPLVIDEETTVTFAYRTK